MQKKSGSRNALEDGLQANLPGSDPVAVTELAPTRSELP